MFSDDVGRPDTLGRFHRDPRAPGSTASRSVPSPPPSHPSRPQRGTVGLRGRLAEPAMKPRPRTPTRPGAPDQRRFRRQEGKFMAARKVARNANAKGPATPAEEEAEKTGAA